MITAEEAAKYFNDCKPKHLSRFSEKTPEGNCIEGWICRKPNRYLGSLVIDKVNGESVVQFVQSMPKIEYFNDERDISLNQDIIAYEKLDGTCLIVYPLLDEHRNLLEIVPKTRGRAVCDKNFLSLYNKMDNSNILRYYEKNTGILMFEMYGILNQHEIIHYDTGIDKVLIGCYDSDRFASAYSLLEIAFEYHFKQPDEIFRISQVWDDIKIDIRSRKYRWYFDDVLPDDTYQPTIIDAVDKIQYLMEYLNKTYNDNNGRIASEGVVINCMDSNGYQKYIKIKPRDIENKHRSENGIPRSKIVKEVLKYFDEYDSEVKEIYDKDKNHHTEYLHRMLSEEYNEEIIQKSSEKIERIFMQIWDSKQIPESIHNIGQELFDEYGTKGITHCMRMFAQKYPMKKKNAKTVYQVLEKIFVKNNMDLNGE